MKVMNGELAAGGSGEFIKPCLTVWKEGKISFVTWPPASVVTNLSVAPDHSHTSCKRSLYFLILQVGLQN